MNTICNFDLLSFNNNNKLQNDLNKPDNDFFQDFSPSLMVTSSEDSTADEVLSQLSNNTTSNHLEFILPLFSCRLCTLKFSSTTDLQSHEIICSNNTSSFSRNRDELFNTNFINQTQIQLENQCEICGTVFKRSSSLANHVKIHNYRNIFIRNDTRNNPLPSINNIKTTNSWNLYFESLKTATTASPADEGKEIERLNSCNVCNKSFSNGKLLEEHSKLHSNSLSVLCCNKCNSSFSNNKLYKKHLSNCSESTGKQSKVIDKHKCIECDKRFTTKQKLQRHLWIHRKTTVLCEICSNTFETNKELTLHRLTIHSLHSDYVCKDCGKFFTSRQGLWEHSRMHNTKSAVYECSICLKTFLSRQGYLIHKRIHNNERPYSCKFCCKSFRDGGTLRKHERIHTGERPHACPLCLKTFNQRVILREHIRCLHCTNCEVNSQKMVDCPLCEQVINGKDEFCVHILKHSDEMGRNSNEGGKN